MNQAWFRRQAKKIFEEEYPDANPDIFQFSRGWFDNFLRRHRISLRCSTKKTQNTPSSYRHLIINWLRFNRRNTHGPTPLEKLVPVTTPGVNHLPSAEVLCLALATIQPNNFYGGANIPPASLIALPTVGRFYLKNIANIDEVPLQFEFLDARTYNITGNSTVWVKESRSGWDKRQATLMLCIFADGILRIKPLITYKSDSKNAGRPQFPYSKLSFIGS